MEDMIYTLNIPWRPLQEFPGTAEVKVLRGRSHVGAQTLLIRIPSGGEIAPHTHLATVQHYVIEGAYQTRGQNCPVGTYRLLMAGVTVDPIATQDGVTFLMIYDPAALAQERA